MTNIALRIRRARAQAKLSQSELAGRVGVNRSAVAQWEREGGTHPSVEHLATVSIATRVPFEWLATGRGDPAECPSSEAPAVALQYAVDDTEARLLEAIRRLPVKTRHAVCRLIEELASKG